MWNVLLSTVVYIDQKEALSNVNNNLKTTVFYASGIKNRFLSKRIQENRNRDSKVHQLAKEETISVALLAKQNRKF